MPKPPIQSPIRGIDIVTGHPATTGGPYASPNPVKPHGHPLAVAAQRINKTGPFKEGTNAEETIEQHLPKNPQATKIIQDEAAKQVKAAEAVKAVPTSTGKVDTVGTQAATTAPVQAPKPVAPLVKPVLNVKQSQGMNKPTIASQHVPTSTVNAPHAIPPELKVKLDAEGHTSKDEGTEVKDSSGT